MLKIGLIQPNFQTGPKHLNSYYLPYTVGCLWSFASQFSDITDNFEISEWVFSREDIDNASQRLSHCDILFFSMYIWNGEYNYRLMSEVKRINPDILTIAGGPQIAWRDNDLFMKHPYMDSVVVNEGETGFVQILRNILNREPIPQKVQMNRMSDLQELPSPYLTGVFDKLIHQHPDIEWVPTLETDRGCPFKCTFCDWGSATGSKMHKLNIDRIRSEINWFADNGMPYLSMTTSNFGAFKQRDIEVANIIVECNKRTGMPTAISTSYGKNNADTVFEISKMLLDAGIQTGAAVSFQSTTPEVLRNIKRDNMKINRVSEVTAKAKSYNMPVLTELIIGLPGETYDTWVDSVCEVFANKIINLDIFYLQLIENAPMNINDRETYDLQTFVAYDYFYEASETMSSDLSKGTAEIINVIKSTSTLSADDLYNCSEFSWFVVGMHCYGVTTHISDYLNSKLGITYREFYTGLLDHMKADPYFHQWFSDYKIFYKLWQTNGYAQSQIGGYGINGGWRGMNSFMPIIQLNKKLGDVIDSVVEYVERYDLDSDVISDFRNIVPLYVKQYDHYLTEPVHLPIKSDLLGGDIVVRDRYNHYPTNLSDHLDYLFFARRRNWYLNVISVS